MTLKPKLRPMQLSSARAAGSDLLLKKTQDDIDALV